MKKHIILIMLLSFTLNTINLKAAPTVGSGFTYQGELIDNGTPANGDYDIQIDLYLNLTGGSPISSLTFSPITVTNGLFNIDEVDFGDIVYAGHNQFYLEIAVMPSGGAGFDVLIPRERLSAVPYAVQAEYLAPGIASNGDVLQFNGSDWVPSASSSLTQWQDASANRVYYDAGFVGIGTNSPASQLSVESASSSVANFNGTNNSSVYFNENNAPRGYVGSRDTTANDEDFAIGTAYSNFEGDLHLTIRYEPKLTINEDTGQVGVGTTNPNSTLHISSEPTDNPLRVQVNASTKLIVNNNGGTALGSNHVPPTNGLYVHGNTEQRESAKGMLKYMFRATCDSTPTIDREYNGTEIVGSAVISYNSAGNCTITIPFDLNNNYISTSAIWAGAGSRLATCANILSGMVCTVTNAATGAGINGSFDVLIY